MRKSIFILILAMLVSSIIGCTPQVDITGNNDSSKGEVQNISDEERQRIALYVSVMKAAFNEENGGNEFIAVKLDTLTDLSDKAKEEVLKELVSLSKNVYDFEKVKNVSTRFELDGAGNLVRSINGTLLYVDLEEYSSKKAVITGVSWFGNLGAVFPQYEATYKDRSWELKLISMAIS